MSHSFKRVVEAGYDRMAEQYLSTRDMEDSATLAALERLARDLPFDAAVLDLGWCASLQIQRGVRRGAHRARYRRR